MSTLPTNILTLFLTFLKSGGLTVGDGYAIIHPLRRAIVETNGWMTADEFAEHLSLVQAMPGIFNVNFATYMGRQLLGWKGSAAALLGMLLPPIVILIVLPRSSTISASFLPYSPFYAAPALPLWP